MADDTTPDSDARTRPDPTAGLRVRARRRLVGAAALLLAVIVIVPAVLDPVPKPLPDAIPIEIPSEKSPFTPRLSLPPLPEAATGSVADVAPAPQVRTGEAVPDTAARKPAAAAVPAAPEKAPEVKPSDKRAVAPQPVSPRSSDATVADTANADARRARDLLEGRATGPSDKATDGKARFVLQAAAPSSETAARELAERISASGLKSFVEKFEARDGVRYRVRVGPYGTRDEAERARARLRAIGVNSNVVAL